MLILCVSRKRVSQQRILSLLYLEPAANAAPVHSFNQIFCLPQNRNSFLKKNLRHPAIIPMICRGKHLNFGRFCRCYMNCRFYIQSNK
ncbi:MAG: hypothetical protein DWI22_05730 [Planctomycetota bacterium]|nr:MAG: hypothetical protein DWI22_05730 [Planctomycetota bacterium]